MCKLSNLGCRLLRLARTLTLHIPVLFEDRGVFYLAPDIGLDVITNIYPGPSRHPQPVKNCPTAAEETDGRWIYRSVD